jgi:hypothetical protein
MIAASFDGVARFVWSRNRLLLYSFAAFYLAAYVCNQMLSPELLRPYSLQAFPLLRLLPFILPLALFVSTVRGSTMDLARQEGYFPRIFFTLPVRAREMVLPFMAYSAGLAATLWALGSLVSDGRALRFGPPGTPVEAQTLSLWIPFVCTSLIAWIQSISWTPFSRRWHRVWALLAALVGHAVVVTLTATATLSHGVAITLSLVQFPLAYVVAAHGVAKERNGETRRGRRDRDAHAATATPRPLHTFGSAFDAQMWFENRIHGWSGKSTLLIAVPAAILVILIAAWLNGGESRDPEAMGVLAGAVIVLCLLMLFAIAIMTGYSFASFRKFGTWTQKDAFAMPSFFAALPMSTGDFAWAKLRAVFATMAWVCGGVLLVCTSAAMLGHLVNFSTGWLATLRQQHGNFTAGVMLLLPVLALVLLVLTGAANCVCMTLPGRPWSWRSWNWFGVLNAVWLLSLGYGAAEIAHHWSKFGGPATMLPVAIRTIAVFKVCELAAVSYYLGTRRLQSWSRLALITAAWLATVGTSLAAAVMWFLPKGSITTPTAAATIVILAPVLGMIAAPLALHINRCR